MSYLVGHSQNFLSKIDQHDLNEIYQSFIENKIDQEKLNKFSIQKEGSDYFISLIAKTSEAFRPSQIEALGGKARKTINNITNIKLPLSSI